MGSKIVLAIFGLLAFGMGSVSAQDCPSAVVTDHSDTEPAGVDGTSGPASPTPAASAVTAD
jgi:hypothetical protein